MQSANPEAISVGLTAILRDKPYDLPTQEEAVDVDPAILKRYVGTYQVAPEFQVRITAGDGQLHIQGTGNRKFLSMGLQKPFFFAKVLEFRIVVNVSSKGTAESATLLQNDQEIPAPKAE